jgi:hypothetical protein
MKQQPGKTVVGEPIANRTTALAALFTPCMPVVFKAGNQL